MGSDMLQVRRKCKGVGVGWHAAGQQQQLKDVITVFTLLELLQLHFEKQRENIPQKKRILPISIYSTNDLIEASD